TGEAGRRTVVSGANTGGTPVSLDLATPAPDQLTDPEDSPAAPQARLAATPQASPAAAPRLLAASGPKLAAGCDMPLAIFLCPNPSHRLGDLTVSIREQNYAVNGELHSLDIIIESDGGSGEDDITVKYG